MTMESFCEDLQIPKNHLFETDNKDRYFLLVNKSWLKCLEQQKKLTKFQAYPGLDKRSLPQLNHIWTKVCIHIYKKYNHKVIPLPKSKIDNINNNEVLTHSEILDFVSQNNFHNLWNKCYRKYNNNYNKSMKTSKNFNNKTNTNRSLLVPYESVLKELIYRIFGKKIIHYKLDRIRSSQKINYDNDNLETYSNLLQAIAAIETTSHITVIFYPPAIETTLYDCITYSPAILNKSNNKTLFIIYQLIKTMKYLHEQSLLLGDIRLNDIYITENLWIQILPNLESNIIQEEYDETPTEEYPESLKFDLKFTYDYQQFTLREYCEMWCNGQLSNYDYLTILNNVSGRKISSPSYHHIMPWVTDFTLRNGINWRDLTKSKYRINKGDRHLDLMFTSHHNSEIPHHVSEFLSEITYFVYMARRTPSNILCQHVRPVWVPAEYPASIQRLQEWSPDECIPEFYSDPMVFKSIHEDLPDLELPAWASCPEDFISKHREALESQHVSERLHHWIDLNFGYKLHGIAAIKSKNVCLPLVDNHKHLCQRGIVQLFTYPHPAKKLPSIWFNSIPPRLNLNNQYKNRMTRSSEELSSLISSQTNDNNLIKNSTINTTKIQKIKNDSTKIQENNSNNMERSTSYHSNVQKSSNYIKLPKEYNPCLLLNKIENMQTFFGKTFLNQKSDILINNDKILKNDMMFEDSSDNSFTNQMFSDTLGAIASIKDDKFRTNVKCKNLLVQNVTKNYRQILYEKREKELQIIGCLIIELFLIEKLRPLISGNNNNNNIKNFENRLQLCSTVAKLYIKELPKCIQLACKILLKLDDNLKNEVINNLGLPYPTAHQLLQPLLGYKIIPFPYYYYRIHALISCLYDFDIATNMLNLYTYFQCDGNNCIKFIDNDKKRILFERKIAECKIKSCCLHLDNLLKPIAYEQFSIVELLLPHIINMFKLEQTSILAAWYLFDPLASSLGHHETQKQLLETILHLYDVDNYNRIKLINDTIKFRISSSFKSRKSVKLYHHSFLIRLIIRFGLKCFLNNFISPIIEAIGGYKEPEENNGYHYHNENNLDNNKKIIKFSSNNNESDNSITLISTENSYDITSSKNDTEDLFEFETETDDSITFDKHFNINDCEIQSIDLNADEAREESINLLEKIAINDIIFNNENLSNNNSIDDDKISINSQTDSLYKQNIKSSSTIQIPSSFNRNYDINTIDCEIGSKKSIDSFDLISTKLNNINKKDINEINNTSSSSVISQKSDIKNIIKNNRISEMSTESLIWLSHRLGPVLTAKYLTRNLLKMLTICYVGQENLLPINNDDDIDLNNNLNYFTISDAKIVGDYNAARVLECLTSVAGLYGEQFILLQYLPHASELIALCKRKITPNLEGALVGSLQLLKYIIPYLIDSTIMEQLQDSILRNIIHPVIRLLGSSRCILPNGYLARNILARKLLDTLYVIAIRIGPEMSKEHLCIPALQRFFLIFNKAYGITDNLNIPDDEDKLIKPTADINLTSDDTSFLEIQRDGRIKEWNIIGTQILQAKTNNDNITNESITPPKLNDINIESIEMSSREKAMEEIRDTFGPPLAHCSYLSFLKYLGETIMKKTVVNLELILNFCHEFQQPGYNMNDRNNLSPDGKINLLDDEIGSSNSFGTPVVGNRIEVQTNTIKPEIGPIEVLDLVAHKFDQINTTRHLRGNWLAYWEHEIGRSDKDNHLNLKQIKLQTFAGHNNSVRSILCLDNENSFISASKDKTVKLWSLRSEGDGTKITSCQFTYNGHKKSVHSLSFLESMRLTISCDSGVHIWDPFIGRAIGILDSQTRYSPVSVVRTYPSPSPLIIAGTADSTIKIIDSRTVSYVNEWKITQSQNHVVRCLVCSSSGNWIAAGLSSGNIIVLDGRNGMLLGSWKATDGELLQLVAPNNHQIVSSSLDHSISVWSINDFHLQLQLKQPPEPAHCLFPNDNELVFATPANRIGVYSSLTDINDNYSVTKLRSDTLKGVLTSLAVLPLNRMILAGNDSGNIVLLC